MRRIRSGSPGMFVRQWPLHRDWGTSLGWVLPFYRSRRIGRSGEGGAEMRRLGVEDRFWRSPLLTGTSILPFEARNRRARSRCSGPFAPNRQTVSAPDPSGRRAPAAVADGRGRRLAAYDPRPLGPGGRLWFWSCHPWREGGLGGAPPQLPGHHRAGRRMRPAARTWNAGVVCGSAGRTAAPIWGIGASGNAHRVGRTQTDRQPTGIGQAGRRRRIVRAGLPSGPQRVVPHEGICLGGTWNAVAECSCMGWLTWRGPCGPSRFGLRTRLNGCPA